MTTFQIFLIASIGIALVSSKAALEEEKRLIKTSEDDPGKWMTESEIFSLIKNQQTFIDVTDSKYPAADPSQIILDPIPTTIRYHMTREVAQVNGRINVTRVQEFVRQFSSYHNRYYTAATGRTSQLWLLSEVQNAVRNHAHASVKEFDHGYLQKSIVARIEGLDPTLEDIVIFGAHLDSVNKYGSSLRAPGADDNASGSSVGLETLRAILEAGLRLRRSVEFHWYAAEEIGLRGSQSIAEDYKMNNVSVFAMLNNDVVGYRVKDIDDVGVFTDNGNEELMAFLRILVPAYLNFGWRDRTCGYGCSDHASWTNAGFRAVMASEIVPHSQMHTENDNFENVDFEQVTEFIKLAIGFVIELAEPVLSR